jgi:hypothetical protein
MFTQMVENDPAADDQKPALSITDGRMLAGFRLPTMAAV